MRKNIYLFILFYLLSFSAWSQVFTETNGPFGGKVTSLVYDAAGTKLYGIVNRQLFKSTDNGVNWSRIVLPSPVTLVDDVILDGTKLLAIAEGYRLATSTDGGENWIVGAQLIEGFSKIVKHPASGVLLMLGTSKIIVSVDHGATWKQLLGVSFGGSAILMDMKVTSNGDVFVADATVGLRKYPHPANPGDVNSWNESNWVTVFQPTTLNQFMRIGVGGNDRLFYSHSTPASGGQVELSIDFGATWQTQTLGAPLNWGVWATSPNGKAYLFGNGQYQVFEYTEGAATPWVIKPWPTSTLVNQSVLCAVWRSNTQAFAGSDRDGIFATSNTGNSWAISSTGLKFGEGNQVEITQDNKIIVVQGGAPYPPNVYWYSTDGGGTWGTKSLPNEIRQLYRLPDNTLFILAANYTYTSTDGLIWADHPNPGGVSLLTRAVIAASNDIYGFSADGTVWETLDKGVSWTQITITNAPPSTVWYSQVDRDDDGFFYAHTSDNLTNATKYYKFDSNVSPWTATTFSVDAYDYIPRSLFCLNNKVYISSTGDLLVSTDKGVTWKSLGIDAGYGALPLREGPLNGIALPHEGYISITQNEGKTFANVPIIQPKGIITDISLSADGKRYVASANNSPALEFEIKDDNRLLVPVNEIPPYIDFDWKEVAGGPFGGLVKSFQKTSNDQLFALSGAATSTGAKLFRFNSTALSWEVVRADVNMFTIDATNNNKIYATSGNDLIQSSDNAITFSKISTFTAGANELLVNDVGHLLTCSYNGIYRSTNGGVNFTKVDAGSSYSNLTMSTDGTLLAIKGSNILRSVDKGATWTTSVTGIDFTPIPPVGAGGSPIPISIISLSVLDGGKLGAVTSNNLYRSADGGATWTSILGNFPLSGQSFSSQTRLYVTPTNQYVLVVDRFSSSQVYTSSDGGVTWSKKSDQSIMLNSLIWIGTDMYANAGNNSPGSIASGIVKSTDNGVTFTAFQNNKGITGNKFGGFEIYKTKLFVVANDNLYVSTDKGETLTLVTTAGTQIKGLLKTPDGALLAFGNGIYKTTDATAWIKMVDTGNFIKMAAASASLYYAVNGSGNQVQSSTNLTTWATVALTGLPVGNSIQSIACDASGVLYLNIYNSSKVYQFSSGTLTVLPLSVNAAPNSSFKLIMNDGEVHLYNSRGTLYSSADGVTWTSKVMPDGFWLTISALDYYFVSQGVGRLLVSRDQGKTWQSVGLAASQGVDFEHVIVDEFSGLAYAYANGSALLKSSNIVLLNDNKGPGFATLSPVNTATGVLPTAKLVITFDEAVTAVAGKLIKIVDPANTSGFLQSIEVTKADQADRTFTFEPSMDTDKAMKYSANVDTKRSYFITLEAGAFTDLFGNGNAAVINDLTWKFEMAVTPDAVAPAISVNNEGTTNYLNIQDPSKTIQATITDAIGVDNSKIYYRAITSNATFTSSPLVKTTGNTYEFAVTASAYGSIGLEFYITAADAAGNASRSPATGTHYAYKIAEGVKPTLTTALPAGTLEEHYRIISVPYASTSKTVETILVPALSEFDPKIWRLLTLNGERTGWSEYPGDFSTIEPGVGYWIIYKNGGALSLGVETTPKVTKTSLASITLAPGWNQIGNPYPFGMVWSEVLTANSSATGIGTPKQFKGSGYVNSDVVGATEGAFVYNSGTSAVTLSIPVVTSTSGGRKESFNSTLDQREWMVPITLTSKTYATDIGGIGMSERANVSIDNLDDFNPPPFHTMLQMNFPHPEHRAKALARDVVNTQESYTWNFTVNTNLKGATELTWSNEAFGDNAKELILFDVALQKTINMRDHSRYPFNPKVSSAFRIYYGENVQTKIKPDFILLGDAFPNPSDGKTTIPFTLPDMNNTYQVKLEVFDLLSQKVSTIHEGEMKAGFHSALWTAGADQTGVYVYRLAVSSHSVQSVQTKKIILKR